MENGAGYKNPNLSDSSMLIPTLYENERSAFKLQFIIISADILSGKSVFPLELILHYCNTEFSRFT